MHTILPDLGINGHNFSLERLLYSRGFACVAGCDEAGRGPLAGPVVAACVVLPTECDHSLFIDSKVLTHRKRLELKNHFHELGASFGLGVVSERKIDEINIHQASLLAMQRAVENLVGPSPDFLLIDGKFTLPITIAQASLVKGESKSSSIAAASILAKVERDRIMDEWHQRYSAYNFLQNKGYPTREHRLAIQKNGICPIHRKTFRGVKEYVEPSAASWSKR